MPLEVALSGGKIITQSLFSLKAWAQGRNIWHNPFYMTTNKSPRPYFAQPASLINVLVALTLLIILAQLSFFYAHYKVSDLIDVFTKSSIARDLWHPVILLPLLGFVTLQILAYGFLIAWIWFVTTSVSELFSLSKHKAYWLGISCWTACVLTIFSLNNYYFPASFFAQSFHLSILIVPVILLLVMTVLAYIHVVFNRRYLCLGLFFITIPFLALIGKGGINQAKVEKHTKPNIILIGLDSLRPDHTGYFGNKKIETPNINQFLQTATTFTDAYTPLARTFPAWVSILTAQYPKHHQARINLIDPAPVVTNNMLSRVLQSQGYFTIYGTDETRFTDINEAYGFDRLIGPKGGAVEFLLGGLSDFPLTNLLVNLPVSRYLFPYNYANRAADITYQPNAFLELIKSGLKDRPNKPVFLALHLCLSHWPFTWGQEGFTTDKLLPLRYQHSVEKLDVELGKLLRLLKETGLLEHSVVVLLSDHGVTVGLPNDRAVTKEGYRGQPEHINTLSHYALSHNEGQLSVSTSYGQGTDVLSLKQNQVLLAFKGFGVMLPSKEVKQFSSLLDIAPTLLAMLQLPPLAKADGKSLAPYFSEVSPSYASSPFFIETADTIADMQVDEIFVNKVVKQLIGAYQVNTQNGQLVLNAEALPSIIKSKQRAILWGEWLLASYPAQMRMKFIPAPNDKTTYELKPYLAPAYFVLLNRKTGSWTTDLSSSLAKRASLSKLMKRLKAFYGDEIPN